MSPENLMLNERRQSQKTTYLLFPLFKMILKIKSVETEALLPRLTSVGRQKRLLMHKKFLVAECKC